jgi:hypothetical protein
MNQKHVYTKLAQEFNDSDYVDFLVSNFVSGDDWGGVFNAHARDNYINWKKRIESLSYTFTSDMRHILNELNLVSFDEKIFDVQKNQHPYIIRAYMSKRVSLETLVILQKLFNFCEKFDNEIPEQLVWPSVSRLIKKYSPFVKIKKEKYSELIAGL